MKLYESRLNKLGRFHMVLVTDDARYDEAFKGQNIRVMHPTDLREVTV